MLKKYLKIWFYILLICAASILIFTKNANWAFKDTLAASIIVIYASLSICMSLKGITNYNLEVHARLAKLTKIQHLLLRIALLTSLLVLVYYWHKESIYLCVFLLIYPILAMLYTLSVRKK